MHLLWLKKDAKCMLTSRATQGCWSILALLEVLDFLKVLGMQPRYTYIFTVFVCRFRCRLVLRCAVKTDSDTWSFVAQFVAIRLLPFSTRCAVPAGIQGDANTKMKTETQTEMSTEMQTETQTETMTEMVTGTETSRKHTPYSDTKTQKLIEMQRNADRCVDKDVDKDAERHGDRKCC